MKTGFTYESEKIWTQEKKAKDSKMEGENLEKM